jgi:hypothetical protein
MLTVTTLSHRSNPSHVLATLTIDADNNLAFLHRDGWTDTDRIPYTVAMALAARWPKMSSYNVLTVDATPYFASVA